MSFGEFDLGRTTGRFILEMAKRTLPGFVEGRRNVIYLMMSELMEKISRITDAPMPKSIPLAAARAVSALQAVRYKYLRGPEPKISSSAIAVMALGQFISGEKAAQDLGFAPEVSVDEAIRRTLSWFKSQGLVAAG
jgi:nucleoside-diphosphate-sugar epimerase